VLWLTSLSLQTQPGPQALQERGREGEINLAERGKGASASPVIIQDMLGRHQGKEKLCNILAKARQNPNCC